MALYLDFKRRDRHRNLDSKIVRWSTAILLTRDRILAVKSGVETKILQISRIFIETHQLSASNPRASQATNVRKRSLPLYLDVLKSALTESLSTRASVKCASYELAFK